MNFSVVLRSVFTWKVNREDSLSKTISKVCYRCEKKDFKRKDAKAQSFLLCVFATLRFINKICFSR